jgi:hypothetical protein
VELRPVTGIEVTEILDDRGAGEGKLALEIKASGKGLVPPFKELFDFAPAGFAIEEMTDSGPAIQRLASDTDELTAISERNWLIKLKQIAAGDHGADFRFPNPRSNDLKIAYKRYQDADLVEVKPELALAGLPLRAKRPWIWIAAGALIVAAGVVLAVRLRRRTVGSESRPTYTLPPAITPFSTLQLLREMHGDQKIGLSSEQRNALLQTIAGIEAYYFAKAHNGSSAPDLEAIGRHWLHSATPAGNSPIQCPSAAVLPPAYRHERGVWRQRRDATQRESLFRPIHDSRRSGYGAGDAAEEEFHRSGACHGGAGRPGSR